jgi:hypothetical protein
MAQHPRRKSSLRSWLRKKWKQAFATLGLSKTISQSISETIHCLFRVK